ncbi:uncharacterized protein PITG_12008 [Phytophthora infestans T30-4]|uniref:Uncharacterized protein n=1 Tax=Phytophthora infestans (strain T30-4) TaxID=403677 RepID=D0NHR0_PHYIT|nr:uncharacterized protein PITG_12008 [Phytophthora infestans T30-4]EEY58985.1 hypothetical protein PITG_12008 [Phytophthora infestans T30-4]|eukprot:XP_002901458.1 hypothetical protein PITG_12008 [Phytophthora infestans T30-4]
MSSTTSQKALDPTGGQDPAQSQSTLEWMTPLQDGKPHHLAARRGMRGGHAAMPVPYRQLAPDAREPSFSLCLRGTRRLLPPKLWGHTYARH